MKKKFAKGQMFLLTFIFLSGLIAATTALVTQYGQIDVGYPYTVSDSFLLKSVKFLFQSVFDSDCTKSEQNIEQLVSFFERNPPAGFNLDIEWYFNCQDQILYINLTNIGPGIESRAQWICKNTGCDNL
jgi:hypothetical protein